MTRQRNDEHSTEFGLWLRAQREISSSLGYVTTNLDYVWENYNTGEWMLIEEKRYKSDVRYSQKETMKILHGACKSNKKYKGIHLLVFEKTNPDDGRIWLDRKEVSKQELLSFLQFK